MSLLLFQHIKHTRNEKEREILNVMNNTEEAREKVIEIRSLKDKSDIYTGKVVCDALVAVLSTIRMSSLYNGLSTTNNYNKDIAFLIGWGIVAAGCVIRGFINHKKEVELTSKADEKEESILKRSNK